MQSDRYAGKPMLRVVECYVLDAIDELPADDQQKLEAMAPTLARSVGSEEPTWQGAVEDALALDGTFRESVRADWASRRAAAEASGHAPEAEGFAAAVADSFLQ